MRFFFGDKLAKCRVGASPEGGEPGSATGLCGSGVSMIGLVYIIHDIHFKQNLLSKLLKQRNRLSGLTGDVTSL